MTPEATQLAADSIGLAIWTAQRTGPLTEDSIGIAYLALCRAAVTYEPALGNWASYARQRIRGDILDAWRVEGGYRRKNRADVTALEADQHDEITETEDLLLARYLLNAFHDEAQSLLRRWCAGETKAQIAATEGLSERRIGQVINARLQQLAELSGSFPKNSGV